MCSQPELFGKILGLFICPDQHDISFVQMIGSNSISKNSVIPFNHIYGRIEAFMSKHSPKFCSVEIITKLIKMMEALTFAVHLQNDEYLFPSLLPKGVFMCVQLQFHNFCFRWHSIPKSVIDTTFTLGRRIFRKNNSMILYFSFSSLQVWKKFFPDLTIVKLKVWTFFKESIFKNQFLYSNGSVFMTSNEPQVICYLLHENPSFVDVIIRSQRALDIWHKIEKIIDVCSTFSLK